MSDEKRNEIRKNIDLLAESIDSLKISDNIWIITIGTDFEDQSLRVGIEREGLTDDIIKDIEKKIRLIVGNEIDITIEYTDPLFFN